MVKFLNRTQARGEVESILTNARNDIVIVSPWININDDLISRLTDAGANRNVKMTMVCREKDLRPEVRKKVEQIPNLELYFNEKVHAKCFYNETYMVITSLNLYDSSTGDNWEMGVLLSSGQPDDKSAFNDAKNEAQFIIRESSQNKKASRIETKPVVPKANTLPKVKKEKEPEALLERAISKIEKGLSDIIGDNSSRDVGNGHCLRCGNGIPLNVEAPYCPGCYRVWAKYKDDEFEEHFCHLCGEPADTSMKKPLCASCYKRTKRK